MGSLFLSQTGYLKHIYPYVLQIDIIKYLNKIQIYVQTYTYCWYKKIKFGGCILKYMNVTMIKYLVSSRQLILSGFNDISFFSLFLGASTINVKFPDFAAFSPNEIDQDIKYCILIYFFGCVINNGVSHFSCWFYFRYRYFFCITQAQFV